MVDAEAAEADVLHSLAATDLLNGSLAGGGPDAPTPAPPPAAPPGLLGDACSSSADCGVPHSHCLRGACACIEEPLASSRSHCPGTRRGGGRSALEHPT